MRRFRDRRNAGRRLGELLLPLRAELPIVLALARGGVPVGYEVAAALDAPLDVLVVRKLGVPAQPELGMGAIGEGGVRVLNDDVIRAARVSRDELAAVESCEQLEVQRRADLYRRGRAMLPVEQRTAIVVDDGIATGGTARAAVEIVRAHGARRVVLAVPVAPPEAIAAMRAVADDVFAVRTPSPFIAIGGWYHEFTQTSDDEVAQLLAR
jgi:predicted phosphoribosyltransferase